VTNILIQVNGSTVFNGIDFTNSFVVNAGDTIYIKVTRNTLVTGKFTLIGTII
jgi:hypothetical protein